MEIYEELEGPVFNLEKMRALCKEDFYIRFLYNDLKNRNTNKSEEEIMEVVFNSTVFVNSSTEELYNTL